MNRLGELLHKKNQFLSDEEIVLYIKDEEMIIMYNDGEELIEVSGEVDEKIVESVEWIKEL